MKTDLILKFKQNLFSKVIWSSTFNGNSIYLLQCVEWLKTFLKIVCPSPPSRLAVSIQIPFTSYNVWNDRKLFFFFFFLCMYVPSRPIDWLYQFNSTYLLYGVWNDQKLCFGFFMYVPARPIDWLYSFKFHLPLMVYGMTENCFLIVCPSLSSPLAVSMQILFTS